MPCKSLVVGVLPKQAWGASSNITTALSRSTPSSEVPKMFCEILGFAKPSEECRKMPDYKLHSMFRCDLANKYCYWASLRTPPSGY